MQAKQEMFEKKQQEAASKMEKTMKRQRRDLEKEKVKNKIQASVAFTGANEVQQAQHLAEQAAMTAEEQAKKVSDLELELEEVRNELVASEQEASRLSHEMDELRNEVIAARRDVDSAQLMAKQQQSKYEDEYRQREQLQLKLEEVTLARERAERELSTAEQLLKSANESGNVPKAMESLNETNKILDNKLKTSQDEIAKLSRELLAVKQSAAERTFPDNVIGEVSEVDHDTL
eukprot:SAG31_NODE_16605_length_703_cov_0.503311_1_plen_233_part_01